MTINEQVLLNGFCDEDGLNDKLSIINQQQQEPLLFVTQLSKDSIKHHEQTPQNLKLTNPDHDHSTTIDPLVQPLFGTQESLKDNDDTPETIDLKQHTSSILFLATSTTKCQLKSMPTFLKRFSGILYALAASFLFTCSTFIIKYLQVDFFAALLFRFILQETILIIFIVLKRYRLFDGTPKQLFLQFIRAILAASGLILFYLSYRYIALPDLTTVRYTQVIWTAIIAMIIFREKISIPTILAIILTLTGVICVAQPTFIFKKVPSNISTTMINNVTSNFHIENIKIDKLKRMIGLWLALLCALSISLSIVLNKKLLTYKIKQSIVVFQFSSVTLIILIINQIRNHFVLHMYDGPKPLFTWQFSVAATVSFVQVGSSLMTQKAIKLEHPSIVTVVQSSDILFAIILQNLMTNMKSNWVVLLGSMLVITSIFLVGGHKLYQDRYKRNDLLILNAISTTATKA
ncbi:unnamed protein product [Didymodactylos carnosus]|uniref:EamA domain-containing protein n=1 Tax=Didymodactylos carnosus TaxID=1234261 RepID=A0A814EGI4_9BILA|nr:unnamed protein product [Didymodactylos carnosus]CAF1123095.1 unnamed protein product [Didymodactylos carnosus]CAF3741010.1 unnamed protein product [Didymodactylos carnosus]CAF3898757.1 unnamed protein product [Didymodactylos carnosus]